MPQSHASTSRTRPLVLAAGCFAAAAAQAPGAPIMKHSFMAPFEAVNDFTGMRVISDWELGGSAVAHRGFVRLTAEKQSQKGWIANRNSFEGGEWSLAMELRATGESQACRESSAALPPRCHAASRPPAAGERSSLASSRPRTPLLPSPTPRQLCPPMCRPLHASRARLPLSSPSRAAAVPLRGRARDLVHDGVRRDRGARVWQGGLLDGRSSRHLPLAPRRPSPPRSALTLPPTSAPGLGIFFDTFQNVRPAARTAARRCPPPHSSAPPPSLPQVDQQHHHKHPYIYAMVNDGTQHYVPDAEKKLDKASGEGRERARPRASCASDRRSPPLALAPPLHVCRLSRSCPARTTTLAARSTFGTTRRGRTCRCSTTRACTSPTRLRSGASTCASSRPLSDTTESGTSASRPRTSSCRAAATLLSRRRRATWSTTTTSCTSSCAGRKASTTWTRLGPRHALPPLHTLHTPLHTPLHRCRR